MISSIHIRNYKSIQDLTINCANSFNVLIGANNIGKTTIFEAIHLWKMCYDQNLKKDKAGFYANERNLPFRDMEFIRVYNDMDLYPVGCAVKDATICITLRIEYEGNIYSLGFRISKVGSIDNAYLKIDYEDRNEFKRFEQVATAKSKKLDTFLTVNESRPVANIIAKEPYMYKAQVKDKIAKGKGYEVLRNKLRDSAEEVQTHINNVLQTEYCITEVDRDNKQYITMHVDGKNILSFGSGFLQLAEIFSSIEYLDSEIGILLIDEPDAHMHLKMQKRLIEEFRTLSNTQLFIITHNERFLEYVDESEIIFLNEGIKESGHAMCLESGCKGIVLENLGGCLQQYDKLRYATKIILVEGSGDENFLNKMYPIYERLAGVTAPANVIIKMEGIDTLNGKLISYSRALKGIIPSTCEWLVIRDTDCVPIDKRIRAGNEDIKCVDTSGAAISVVFQEGYGIESTFLAEKEKLAHLLADYYELPGTEQVQVQHCIENLADEYSRCVKDITNPTHIAWNKKFERQKKARAGNSVYKNLNPQDVLSLVNAANIQYIMTKDIMDGFLMRVDQFLKTAYPQTTKPALTHTSIFDYYYSWITSLDNIFESHKELLGKIYT